MGEHDAPGLHMSRGEHARERHHQQPHSLGTIEPPPQRIGIGRDKIETMVRLRTGQRRLLVTHLPALANLAVGSMLFGQILSSKPYSLVLGFTAVAMWAVFFG